MVGRVTAEIIRHGSGLLQVHKLGLTDREHARVLLDHLDPPKGARILDAGCGVGAVAALMSEHRPDLRFSLLNISPAQLALCPEGMERLRGDFHDIPAPAASFDVVMFCYSLGHGLVDACFAEASRVLRQGSVLFGYDITADEPGYTIDHLGYRPHTPAEIIAAARRHGFLLETMADDLAHNVDDFIRLFGAQTYAVEFAGTRPLLYRFRKSVH
jgi:SAM-dependent methyltransferase